MQSQSFGSLVTHFVVFLVLGMAVWAISRPFFRRSPVLPMPQVRIGFFTVLGGFILYILSAAVFSSLLLKLARMSFSWPKTYEDLQAGLPWLQLVTLWLMALALGIYAFCLKRTAGKLLARQPSRGANTFRRIAALGMLSWIVAFPWSAAAGQLGGLLQYALVGRHQVEQTAVRFLKTTFDSPALFSLTALTLVVIVPIMEEFLFRGLLQNWLKSRVSFRWAIALSALVFALFHFNMGQGWGNLEIVLSLFVFGLFLGRVYEGLASLWGSIALHGTYNAVTILFLLFER